MFPIHVETNVNTRMPFIIVTSCIYYHVFLSTPLVFYLVELKKRFFGFWGNVCVGFFGVLHEPGLQTLCGVLFKV